jgi:hypothetical protein
MRYGKIISLSLLIPFLFITLFINFLHTETTVSSNDNCPACHFQNTSITTQQINTFFIPQPAISGILKTLEFFHYTYLYIIDPNSRAPPKI